MTIAWTTLELPKEFSRPTLGPQVQRLDVMVLGMPWLARFLKAPCRILKCSRKKKKSAEELLLL